MELLEKEKRLRSILAEGGRTLLAYSGGVDSAFLAVLARDVLGDGFLAVLADSASLADWEKEEALGFAGEQRIPVRVLETRELDREDYRRNEPDRCFHCKTELFTAMEELAGREGFDTLIYGGNLSDRRDERPGAEAARRYRVRAPLEEAGLEKEEIRELARQRGLSIWDKPARACLASRIPFFSEVTEDKLRQVGQAERCLDELGFREYRVRHHGSIARIELAEGEWERMTDPGLRRRLGDELRSLGFASVVLDLAPFASGSLSRLSRDGSLTGEDGIP